MCALLVGLPEVDVLGVEDRLRSNRDLLDAAALGLTLLIDQELQEAIRQGPDPRSSRAGVRLSQLRDQRAKLVRLHDEDKISADQFGQEQARLTFEIQALEAEDTANVAETIGSTTSPSASSRSSPSWPTSMSGRSWGHATEAERRSLLDEPLDRMTVRPDRLVVSIHGAPPLNAGFAEVGLEEPDGSASRGVRGAT